jgi:hypothetical protein
MFVVDMHSPGIRIEPLRQMNGGSGFNEIFFEDVVLPPDATVGEVGRGWHVAIVTLMNERVAIGAGRSRGGSAMSAELAARARAAGRAGDGYLLDQIADVYVREQVLKYLSEAVNEAVLAGRTPGPQGSIAKLFSTDLGRRGNAAARRLAAPGAGLGAGDAEAPPAGAAAQRPAGRSPLAPTRCGTSSASASSAWPEPRPADGGGGGVGQPGGGSCCRRPAVRGLAACSAAGSHRDGPQAPCRAGRRRRRRPARRRRGEHRHAHVERLMADRQGDANRDAALAARRAAASPASSRRHPGDRSRRSAGT